MTSATGPKLWQLQCRLPAIIDRRRAVRPLRLRIPDYTGEIVFWSPDPLATTPVYYRFQRSDQGIAYFANGVTFGTTGTQELYVFDLATLTVYGYAAYEVRP